MTTTSLWMQDGTIGGLHKVGDEWWISVFFLGYGEIRHAISSNWLSAWCALHNLDMHWDERVTEEEYVSNLSNLLQGKKVIGWVVNGKMRLTLTEQDIKRPHHLLEAAKDIHVALTDFIAQLGEDPV